MKNQEKALVSVVIPNFNGESYIENCINSVKKQNYENIEIIVVDDASQDRSVEIIKTFENVSLYINEKNSGFDVSINRGIRAASGEYLLLLNNDVVLTPDFITRLVASIEKKERIFSVSSKMVRYYERDKIDDAGDFYHILGWAFKRGDGASVQRYNRPGRVFSACAGAGLYRKSVFDEIGLFDENFFAYMEDVDIGFRAMTSGYENWYEPAAVCYHIGSATTAEGNKYSPFKVRLAARNNIYTVYKNLPLAMIAVNFPFLFFGFSVKAAVFSKRGYGRAYLEGLTEGIKTCGKLERIRFNKRRIANYLKIEGMLMGNLPYQIVDRVRKIDHSKSRVSKKFRGLFSESH